MLYYSAIIVGLLVVSLFYIVKGTSQNLLKKEAIAVPIIVAVILGLLSPIMLLILLIAPLMIKFARPYLLKQVKKETFISSVKILMVFQLVQVLLFFVSLIKF